MSLGSFARENGWAQLLTRATGSGVRRFRDSFTARTLGAPGFRCGRHPRLLGLRHMRVGCNFAAGDNLWLEAVTSYVGEAFSPELVIGDDVSFSDCVHIACLASVTIGAGTLSGSRVIISDHAHGTYRGPGGSDPATLPARRRLDSAAPVRIGRNVWLGDGVAVLAGAQIGDGAVIGANAVVTSVIPAGTIAVGAPARAIRRWDASAAEWLKL